MKKERATFIITLLLLLIMQSLPHTVYSACSITDDQDSSNLSTSFLLLPFQGNYLGRFIRGEDIINISGSLVTEDGTPVENADIYLYLNASNGNDFYLGTYKTDSNGQFNISFLLPLETPVGNTTLSLIFPGDLSLGLAPTYAYYWFFTYGYIYVNLELNRNELALFENNVSSRAWAFFDNGTKLMREGLNFSFYVYHYDELINSVTVETDANGDASYVIYFDETGTYKVIVEFNVSEYSNILSSWFLASQQSIVNGIITGLSISDATQLFEVYLAVKIDLIYEETINRTLYIERNGSKVRIIGRFLNATGYPKEETLRLLIKNASDDSIIRDFLVTTNSSGIFVYELVINAGYELGLYKITAEDLDAATIDIVSPLLLGVVSRLKLDLMDVIPDPGDIISSKAEIYIRGNVSDLYDRKSLAGVSIKCYMHYIDQGNEILLLLNETMSDTRGIYEFYIKLAGDIPNRTIDIILTAEYSSLYKPDYITIEYEVYNYYILAVRVNQSEFVWIIEENMIMALSEPVIRDITTPSIILLNISLYDDFNRSTEGIPIVVLYNDLSVFQGILEPRVMITVNVTEAGDIQIIFPSLNISVTILVVIYSPRGGGESSPIINYYMFLLVIPIVVMAFLIIIMNVRVILIKRIKYGEEGIEIIIHKIREAIISENYQKLASIINTFIRQLAKQLGIIIQSWMTLREILRNIRKVNKIRTDLYEIMDFLVTIYEKILFGNKIISKDDIRKLLELLEKLETNIQRILNEGVSRG